MENLGFCAPVTLGYKACYTAIEPFDKKDCRSVVKLILTIAALFLGLAMFVGISSYMFSCANVFSGVLCITLGCIALVLSGLVLYRMCSKRTDKVIAADRQRLDELNSFTTSIETGLLDER